jgi:hypothetical protein
MTAAREPTTNQALAALGYTTAPSGRDGCKLITAPGGGVFGPFTALECSTWLARRHPGIMDGSKALPSVATLRALADLERQLADARQGLVEVKADIAAKIDGDDLPPIGTLQERAAGLCRMVEAFELALSSARGTP